MAFKITVPPAADEAQIAANRERYRLAQWWDRFAVVLIVLLIGAFLVVLDALVEMVR